MQAAVSNSVTRIVVRATTVCSRQRAPKNPAAHGHTVDLARNGKHCASVDVGRLDLVAAWRRRGGISLSVQQTGRRGGFVLWTEPVIQQPLPRFDVAKFLTWAGFDRATALFGGSLSRVAARRLAVFFSTFEVATGP